MKHELPTLASLHHAPEVAFKNDQFNLLMNQQPHETWLKLHKYVDKGNHKYLPIDKVEFLLNRVFGRYEVEVRSIQQLFNSVVVIVRVHVTHPVSGEKIFQDGVGAVAAQTDKDEAASNLQAIKANAIQIAAPAAESYAIKDAAEKFGAIFGRDLNKKDIIPFQGAYAQVYDESPAPAPNGANGLSDNSPF